MPGDGSKVKVTLYYWPDANKGFGHVACLVQEIPKQDSTQAPEATYVSPGFFYLDKSAEEYFDAEIATYESPNVIKIELPESSSISYDEFLKALNEKAVDPILDELEEYNFLTNNCAHLSGKVLSIVYGKDMNLEPATQQPLLLPSQIARAACSYLDLKSGRKDNIKRLQTLAKLGPTAEAKFTTGTVSRISKFEFAESMILIKLDEISAIQKELDEQLKPGGMISLGLLKAFLNFNTAVIAFGDLLGQKNPSDSDLTKSFTELKTKMDSLEKELGKSIYSSNLFKKLKFWLYKFLGIILQDPKLESLRSFRKAVDQVKPSSADLGIDTKSKVPTRLPGKT